MNVHVNSAGAQLREEVVGRLDNRWLRRVLATLVLLWTLACAGMAQNLFQDRRESTERILVYKAPEPGGPGHCATVAAPQIEKIKPLAPPSPERKAYEACNSWRWGYSDKYREVDHKYFAWGTLWWRIGTATAVVIVSGLVAAVWLSGRKRNPEAVQDAETSVPPRVESPSALADRSPAPRQVSAVIASKRRTTTGPAADRTIPGGM